MREGVTEAEVEVDEGTEAEVVATVVLSVFSDLGRELSARTPIEVSWKRFWPFSTSRCTFQYLLSAFITLLHVLQYGVNSFVDSSTKTQSSSVRLHPRQTNLDFLKFTVPSLAELYFSIFCYWPQRIA